MCVVKMYKHKIYKTLLHYKWCIIINAVATNLIMVRNRPLERKIVGSRAPGVAWPPPASSKEAKSLASAPGFVLVFRRPYLQWLSRYLSLNVWVLDIAIRIVRV